MHLGEFLRKKFGWMERCVFFGTTFELFDQMKKILLNKSCMLKGSEIDEMIS